MPHMVTKSVSPDSFASVPMKWVGPVSIQNPECTGEYEVPLATFESPLWPSVARGAKVTVVGGGLKVTVVDERMTRSVVVEAPGAAEAVAARDFALAHRSDLEAVTKTTSRFARLKDIHSQIAGNLLFLRFAFDTGDAAGHNMATKAADAILRWLLDQRPDLNYVSISGNYCCDKKPSAVNGILGRGKYVVAEMVISPDICRRLLKTTPEKVAALNVKKNLIGTLLAGGLRSANAHFANMLLGIYLATGQDAANIVEGSQGIVHAEAREQGLYFSATLPNVIVGTTGNGKDLPFVEENLQRLGCRENRATGENARRLAIMAAATVWCGELSLLAAQTNPGELMRAHEKLERK
ncbi:MAG TPA: hydroxymethylglutaryl-CoA reductase [Kiritimatiellia bacterium]|nr:hydroxymethylglutaryl-CoA reductase [Kiritimatiellia bacterium]